MQAMRSSSRASTWRRGKPPNDLELRSGARLSPIDVTYETYGELTPERDNTVLICHALSGDAHDRTPAINVWEAVRYVAPGVMAHKSALAFRHLPVGSVPSASKSQTQVASTKEPSVKLAVSVTSKNTDRGATPDVLDGLMRTSRLGAGPGAVVALTAAVCSLSLPSLSTAVTV